ncbi:amino acid adenylation domain-containing protein [Tumebacillus lipolyticus]|uniref:Amino acid adenylation domain-containing protein n=1 Tax=Tumebacillus lipolyticus TaxID=1280370 RepID=A0ABW4ZTG5_9BACL
MPDERMVLTTLDLRELSADEQNKKREQIVASGRMADRLQACLFRVGEAEYRLDLALPLQAHDRLRDLLLMTAAGYESELSAGKSSLMSARWKESLSALWLSEQEREQLVVTWNLTASDYPREMSIPELFEEQVVLFPDRVAVVDADLQLTYQELNLRANRLARRLRSSGVGPDVLVGICVERSVDLVVGLLGILKAGGAYVPFDLSYPQERLAFMLADTEVRALVTRSQLQDALPAHDAQVVCLDELPEGEASNLACVTTADNLAYVMYTSGSTGLPKGVMIPQRGVIRLVRDANYLPFGPEQVFLQAAAVSFDAATLEIWGALLNGARVVLLPHGASSLEEIGRAIKAHGVSVLWLTAGLFHQMVEHRLDDLRGVRYLLAGGDVLSPAHVQKALRELEGVCLINGYGPTENTTFTCCYAMRSVEDVGSSVLIGRPISNTKAYVLDAGMQPVPIGVPGELYAGGDGLARGYWKRDELTAAAFLPSPFVPGERLYRTGDLVRYLPDGNLQFLGRIDSQVKIRGYRIEVGEIEAALSQHQAVQECVVAVREDRPGDKQLVAYLVLAEERFQVAEWRAFLAERLPAYMIPAAFVRLDALPLTPNGKVDKRRLPAPDPSRSSLSEAYVAPQGRVEEAIATIWAQVFRLERVGVHDDFYELGGHSLLATQILSRIRSELGVEVTLRDVLEARSVRSLAHAVSAAPASDANDFAAEKKRDATKDGLPLSGLPPADRTEPVPASFAQRRLWFLDRLEAGSSLYNLPLAMRLKGKLDHDAVTDALTEVVRRHQALRTVFAEVDGHAVQVVREAEPVRLTRCETWQQLQEAAGEPFDLTAGPLFRATLLQERAEEHVLLLNMHHIVSDGWSLEVLRREFATLYASFVERKPAPLDELPVQYGDYTSWQQSWLSDGVLEAQIAYWKEQLSGELPVLQLPSDRPRPAVNSFRGGSKRMMLPSQLVEALKELSRQEGATLYMTMLSAFKALLHRYAELRDVIVGTPISGRNRAEVEGLIGFFVNTLVLRTQVAGEMPFRELLARVRETALGAFAHQDVPFDTLVAELQPERDGSHSPFFQTMFVFESTPKQAITLPGLVQELVELDNGTAKFDLSLLLMQETDGLAAVFEYSSDLFDERTIERLMGHYLTLLAGIVEAPERSVAQLPLLGEEEREQLLAERQQTGREYGERSRSLFRLFESQAARTPDAIALVAGEQRLTYRQLSERADLMARELRRRGVSVGSVVGVCLERSVAMVVSLLAVLKAGAAYLPLDPEYPQERLLFMLEDSQASVLLTGAELRHLFAAASAQLVELDAVASISASDDRSDCEVEVAATDPAYVIYTSGSTGQPKGVVVPHGAICNHMLWMQDEFPLGCEDAVLQKTSFSFDASVWEFYAPLLAGGRLVLAEPLGHLDGRYLAQVIQEEKVTVLQVVPTMLSMLLSESSFTDCHSLKRVFCGGEALSPELVARFYSLMEAELVNLYGPTEACIDATFYRCPRAEAVAVPIGRPIANVHTYVLDEHQELVPYGVPGELHIGGAGLALGYLHRPELTAERFVETQFGRLYKTGDLVRKSADGLLHYAGRIDSQVKLRGFRIELGEIEGALTAHPAIGEAVVTVHDSRVIGYLVERASVADEELRAFVKNRLPDYMVPAQFVRLDALPQTANGKVDRKALPQPVITEGEDEFVQPRTAVETVLAVIFAEALELEQVGVTSNFFALGGHSLLGMQIISQIREVLEVDVAIKALFDAPTVAGLASAMQGDQEASQRLEKTAELLLQLSEMSEEEAQMMMEAKR